MAENENKLWDDIYLDFKENRFSVWMTGPHPWLAQKVPFLKKEGIIKILDAGCGDGRNLLFLAQEGFEATGIDFSKEALKKSERVKERFPNVVLKKMRLEDLSFESEFDAVLCDYVLTHILEIEKVLENFHKAVKKDGLILLQFFTVNDPHFGNGKKIRENVFLEKDIITRFVTINDIYKLLEKFQILCIDRLTHKDPSHVKNHPRPLQHKHESFFVLARKK